MDSHSLPVAVIGAGPVGLAAAANLHERGMPFVLFEAGDDIAASVRDWGHVTLFSLHVDGRGKRSLELEAAGEVCGQWLQPPTSVVTQVFTGRYDVTSASSHRLIATEGFYELRLADDGRARIFAIDT